MPITLRPSDVLSEAAGAFAKFGEVFQQIFAHEYEKERVKQVNSGLVTLEEFWQKQLDDYPKQGFEVRDNVVPGQLQAADIAPTIKSLGQLSAGDVLQDFHKSTKALEDNIRRTVTNKKAREEMLQHLAAGAVQQQGRLLGLWKTAAQASAMAGLQSLANLVMMQPAVLDETGAVVSGTADEKTARIKSRLDEMVLAGWIEVDKAGEYLAGFENQARYVEARNGAAQVMEVAGREAAEQWLKANTPYWEGNPELRQKVLDDTWRAFQTKTNAQAMEQDTLFSDIFVKATTVEQIKAAIQALHANPLMQGTQKHTWEMWLQDKLARAEAAEKPAPGDVVSALYSRLYSAMDGHRNPGLEVSIAEIDRTVTDPEDHQAVLAKRNELQRSYESGVGSTREEVLLAGYDIVYHPNMSVKAKQEWIDAHAKADGGLSAQDANKLRSWIDSYNDNPDRKKAMDAITEAYRLSMANPSLNTQAKKNLALELYNARNAMEMLFINPKTTPADIERATTEFLSDKIVADVKTLIIEAAGVPVTGFATGEWRRRYREATTLEYLREQGKLTGEAAAQYPQGKRKEAEQLEQDALRKAGIKTGFTARLSSGDLVYSAKPIAKGATGKLLMSDTGDQGTLYQVRYQIKNGEYVPTVYRQNPRTAAFDIIEWEWK